MSYHSRRCARTIHGTKHQNRCVVREAYVTYGRMTEEERAEAMATTAAADLARAKALRAHTRRIRRKLQKKGKA